ncbi:MAG: hypothetical protein P4L53_03660 [Candidatus Obscuribacterales bacterium]|nr:hypothetical protein [Candidatus Obscuribacterales bacterium]
MIAAVILSLIFVVLLRHLVQPRRDTAQAVESSDKSQKNKYYKRRNSLIDRFNDFRSDYASAAFSRNETASQVFVEWEPICEYLITALSEERQGKFSDALDALNTAVCLAAIQADLYRS